MTTSLREDEPQRRRPYAPRMPLEQRREMLLDAALALVADAGYAAVSMEAVAREAGVTKPVVYGVFGNADEVLEALIQRESLRAFEQMLRLLPEDIDLADPQAATIAGMTGFLAAVRADPVRWGLALARDAGMPAAATRAAEEARRFFVDRFAELAVWAFAERPGGPLDPVLIAHLMVGALESGARLVLDDPDTFTEERMVSFVSEVVRAFLHS